MRSKSVWTSWVALVLFAAVSASSGFAWAATSDVAGRWSAYWMWEDLGDGSGTWTITSQGRARFYLTSTTGNEAQGLDLGGVVVFYFPENLYPIYVGEQSSTQMAGFMFATDGSDYIGYWYATKISSAAKVKPEASSGLDESGQD
jgi:hypothetical protein